MNNIYNLSRYFWDFAFENTGKIKPVHISIYFFAVEHCNRLGWKKNFGLPTSMVLEAITVKSYSVYKKAFDDLVEFGFFEVVQYSKNQYSSNIIALKENSKANVKALDKALAKHQSKQTKSTSQSIVSIDIQDTIIQDTTLHNTHTLQKFILDYCLNVSKIQNQLSVKDCEMLVKNFGQQKVEDILLQMENKKDLAKKYTSVFLTANNWLKLSQEKSSKGLKENGVPLPSMQELKSGTGVYGNKL